MSFKVTSDTSDNFRSAWLPVFGDVPPVAHVMRWQHHDAWTRFHALPNSKRYATSEDESATILLRANSLGNTCFATGAEIWLVTSLHEGYDNEDNGIITRCGLMESFSWISDWEEPEDQSCSRVFAGKVHWTPQEFDRLFSSIANDEERALWFDPGTRTAFAPYDGGFDIVSLMPKKFSELEAEFHEWMSERPDKL